MIPHELRRSESALKQREKAKQIDNHLNDLFEQANGNGKLQILAFLIVSAATGSTGYFFYNLSYLELMPVFTCNYIGSSVLFTCKETDFCSDPTI